MLRANWAAITGDLEALPISDCRFPIEKKRAVGTSVELAIRELAHGKRQSAIGNWQSAM